MKSRKYIELIGKRHQKCYMCVKYKNMNFYNKWPHPAIYELMPEEQKRPIQICRDCANREAGTKIVNTFENGRQVKRNTFE